MLDSAAVKAMALEAGADLVGIASVDRFANVPPEANPKHIKPDTASVIVLGFRIPRGALRGVEEGTAWQTYALSLAAILAEATYLFCSRLESEGWEATPLFTHSADMRNQGIRVDPDKPEPNVILDMDYAAHAAGLGEVGLSKQFLTPQFGPRQVFTAVLTDLAMAADEPFAGKVCDECGACVAACPARALDAERVIESPLCEGVARWRSLHIESCQICKTGTARLPHSTGAEPFRVAAACGRACVAHLEDEGRLATSFQHPFRGAAV